MKNSLLSFVLLLLGSFAFAQGPITEICMVTVDTGHTHNVVVWEKASQISTVGIDSMRIYRRTVLGMDSLIATVDYDSLSEYHDHNVNVNLKGYMYRIEGIDNLGVVGNKSAPHRTIHFAVIDNGSGNLHLEWSPYIGHTVNSYECWRDSLGSTQYQSVNTTSTANDTTWWDNNTPMSWANLWYKVDVPGFVSCESTRANHNTTRSNKTQPISGTPVDVEENSLQELHVYPNPSNDKFYYQFSSLTWEPITISVMDLSGKQVLETKYIKVSGQYRNEIDLSNMPSGMYFLRISNSSKTLNKKLLLK